MITITIYMYVNCYTITFGSFSFWNACIWFWASSQCLAKRIYCTQQVPYLLQKVVTSFFLMDSFWYVSLTVQMFLRVRISVDDSHWSFQMNSLLIIYYVQIVVILLITFLQFCLSPQTSAFLWALLANSPYPLKATLPPSFVIWSWFRCLHWTVWA